MALLPVSASGAKTDSAKFAVQKEGPCTVYSGDIECTTGNAGIVAKKVPLAVLGKNQRIKIEMEAVLGTGKTHSKWQPCSVSYYQIPRLSLENAKDAEAIAKAFPGVVELKAKKAFLADPYNAKQATEIRDRFPSEVSLEFDDHSFVVVVETASGKTNEEILEDAVESLKTRNQEFREALKSL